MSLTYRSYKLVTRMYLQQLIDRSNENCHFYNCTFCKEVKEIKLQLFEKGYQTFNKDVESWEICEVSGKVTISPSPP